MNDLFFFPSAIASFVRIAAPMAPIMPGYGARTILLPVYCSKALKTASFRNVPPWTMILSPEGIQIRDADDLREDVLDDGTAESRHDVLRLLAVSLLGDDTAVHEDSAAAAEDCRSFRPEGGGGDLRHRDL